MKSPPQFDVELTAFDRVDLHLDDDAALALCEKDTHAVLAPLPEDATGLGADGIGKTAGLYEAAEILFPRDWSALAHALGGTMLVAIPTRDTVLYAKDGNKAAVEALTVRARYESSQVDFTKRLPDDVFRFTDHGFEQVTDVDPE